MMPPLNLNLNSTEQATSGNITSPWDSSGFTVNYGNGSVVGATSKNAMAAALCVIAWFFWG